MMNEIVFFIIFLLLFTVIYLFYKLKNLNKNVQTLSMHLEDRENELDLFKTIVNNVDVGATITNPYDGNKVIFVNDKFEKLTGYSKDEAIGKNLKFLQNDDTDQESIEILIESLKEHLPCTIQLRNYRKDGSMFDNLLSVTPILDNKGELRCYIGIMHDITHIKHHEHIMAQKEKFDSLKELLTNIAHQWRQPLSVISVNATGMKIKQEYGILDEESIIDTCNVINENTQYLSQVIEEFSTLIETGSKNLNEYDSKNNTSKFIDLIDSTITKYNINMILDLDESSTVKGFSDELIECFVNIFNNSKDAVVANQDEDNRYIFISQKQIDNRVYIEFKDNGGGIDEAVIAKIFEPYYTTKHQSQGTGLGLHIVYNLIVNHMGGSIDVYNETYDFKDQKFTGAVFTITLPINPEQSKEA